jgi:glyoxylase-like metal-dependent hydrolase (beta-lactamase superfamily II)
MNFVYIVGCAETREAAVVDPAWDVPRILRVARDADLRIRHILLTHCHPDHINGLAELLEATDAQVSIHADEMCYMRQASARFGISLDFMNGWTANFKLAADGDELRIGRIPVTCLHTPGHTPGSQCFLLEGNLLSGDTLFVGACGRVDLPGGDPEKMWWSLNKKLAALDDQTALYPGHNYADRPISTIGEQRRSNPYMRYSQLQDFLRDMCGI